MSVIEPGGLLVLGSANMDIGLRVRELPRTGETRLSEEAVYRPGGKGANQAVAAALAGARVRFAGCVGNDPDGQAIRAALVRNGVDVTLLRSTDRHRTGLAVLLVDRFGDNAIVVSPGANHALAVEDLEQLTAQLAEASVLLMQMELPVDVVSRAVELAGEVGTPVVLNLAPPAEVPSAVLARLAVLVVNESEAGFLLGGDLTDLSDLRSAATRLRALGPAAVVVTAGARGAIVDDGTEVVHVPALPVEVVDTTGAGDAFVGALAADISRSAAVREAVHSAVAAGAAAVQTDGAQLAGMTAGASRTDGQHPTA